MSPRSVALKKQRRLARAILGTLVVLVVVFTIFAGNPVAGIAQTATTTNGFTIQFLNPSGLSEEISAKDDGGGLSYHLVAWVNAVPSNASVEFRYNDTATHQTTIGTATQTAIPDTFELSWTIPSSLSDSEDDDFTMTAVLFSNGQEIARDTESDLNLNNQDPDPMDPTDMSSSQAETVEMAYPLNAHPFGFFTPRDKPTLGVIQPSASDGTSFVKAVYTTSAPGTEPIWKTCGTEVKDGGFEDGVKCVLAPADRGQQVTAVGAVANDSATEDEDPILGGYDAGNDDSGDAHRVAPYEQIPTSLTISTETKHNIPGGACSGEFVATLRDQQSVGLPNANLDVHAQGPGDDLFFDIGGSAKAPPQQGGHSKENAIDCLKNPPASAGQQGEHDNTAGADIKHIEGTTGTNDVGQWTFQLFSGTAGGTQFTIWSDLDDDDLQCTTEVKANGSIGWGQPGPGPTGIPSDISSCPSPSPSSPNPGPSTSTTSTSSPDPRGCTITGTEDGEEIVGTPGPDVICGLQGNDVIRGGGGDDVVYGDEGNDDIRGGGGEDSIFGLAGKDTIRGDAGGDYVEGGDDNDIATGGDGRDQLLGQAGFDILRGSKNPDRLSGGSGQDTLNGGPSNDRLDGGPDADTLRGGSGIDVCNGAEGRDSRSGCEKGSA